MNLLQQQLDQVAGLLQIFLNRLNVGEKNEALLQMTRMFQYSIMLEERYNTLEQVCFLNQNSSGPTEFIQGVLRWLGQDFNANRIGIFEETGKNIEPQFRFGIGPELPKPGDKLNLEPEQYRTLLTEGVLRTPSLSVGWDCYIRTGNNGYHLIIAIDDTYTRREFSDYDVTNFVRVSRTILNLLVQKMETDMDTLMKILNRRRGEEKFQAALDRFYSKKLPKQLVIMMGDIDSFKKINDTYGHLTGDAILCYIGSIYREMIKESPRSVNIVSRYGGEEFFILHTDPQIPHKLCEKIAETPYQDKKLIIPITISIGYVILTNKGITPLHKKLILQTADEALYRAKQAGKNRAIEGKIKA